MNNLPLTILLGGGGGEEKVTQMWNLFLLVPDTAFFSFSFFFLPHRATALLVGS